MIMVVIKTGVQSSAFNVRYSVFFMPSPNYK